MENTKIVRLLGIVDGNLYIGPIEYGEFNITKVKVKKPSHLWQQGVQIYNSFKDLEKAVLKYPERYTIHDQTLKFYP